DPARAYHAYPFELSGGMCQRVMIALAVACSPALLIADEPTTGLDVTTQAAILELIGDLARRSRMAMIPITHDLALGGELRCRPRGSPRVPITPWPAGCRCEPGAERQSRLSHRRPGGAGTAARRGPRAEQALRGARDAPVPLRRRRRELHRGARRMCRPRGR